MTIHLSDEMESRIQEAVKSYGYASADDYVEQVIRASELPQSTMAIDWDYVAEQVGEIDLDETGALSMEDFKLEMESFKAEWRKARGIA